MVGMNFNGHFTGTAFLWFRHLFDAIQSIWLVQDEVISYGFEAWLPNLQVPTTRMWWKLGTRANKVGYSSHSLFSHLIVVDFLRIAMLNLSFRIFEHYMKLPFHFLVTT